MAQAWSIRHFAPCSRRASACSWIFLGGTFRCSTGPSKSTSSIRPPPPISSSPVKIASIVHRPVCCVLTDLISCAIYFRSCAPDRFRRMRHFARLPASVSIPHCRALIAGVFATSSSPHSPILQYRKGSLAIRRSPRWLLHHSAACRRATDRRTRCRPGRRICAGTPRQGRLLWPSDQTVRKPASPVAGRRRSGPAAASPIARPRNSRQRLRPDTAQCRPGDRDPSRRDRTVSALRSGYVGRPQGRSRISSQRHLAAD